MPPKVSAPTRPTSSAATPAGSSSTLAPGLHAELMSLAPGNLRDLARLRLSPFLTGRTEVRSLPGVRARAASGIGTATITLTRARDAGLFRAGDVVRSLGPYPEADSPRAGSVTLTAVDETNGTLTASGNWSAGIGAIANGDFLLLDTDVTGRELRIAHMIGRTPVGAIVLAGELVALGMSPELDTVAADAKFLTLRSRVAVLRASLFIL
jgi:hypothetical protein